MDKRKLKLLAISVILYIFSASISYAGFNFLGRQGNQGEKLTSPLSELEQVTDDQVQIDPKEPKTEPCPLNGKLYTKTERKIWEKRRPLAVMIENHPEARPQSGLSFADIVYEAVAEGGITRFMGIFYCGIAARNVKFAPVRSARTYFLDWLSEYDPFYVHVGGAGRCNDPTVDERAKALCQIDKYRIKDMDQFGLSVYSCVRDETRTGKRVATEHQMVCNSSGLYKESQAERFWWNNVADPAKERWDRNFRPWKFAEDDPVPTPSAQEIAFNFWEGYPEFRVIWQYDPATNSYKRIMGGEPHLDWETKQQIEAKNIVIQFTQEIGPVDEHKHLLYKTIGSGKALIFQNGEVIKATWRKSKRTARTLYFTSDGKEVEFVPGAVWIEIVPRGNTVDY